MTEFSFRDLIKPGEGVRLALQRELESQRELWTPGPPYLYRGGADYILKHGQFWNGRVLPDEYEHLRGPNTHCFGNALAACEEDPTLRYVEGWYCPAGAGYFGLHGWCVAADGGIVEVTWPTRDTHRYMSAASGTAAMTPEHAGYWGVIFRPELARWHMEHHTLPMLSRTAAEKSGGEDRGLDMTEVHDWPILKVPYDPNRTSL